MKKLLIPIFSIMISLNSYGEWIKFGNSIEGSTAYIEIDTIKESNGYVYYWVMLNYSERTEYGDMSGSRYLQSDCAVGGVKTLSIVFHKKPMGEGDSETYNPPPEWEYPRPGTIFSATTNYVCDYVNS